MIYTAKLQNGSKKMSNRKDNKKLSENTDTILKRPPRLNASKRKHPLLSPYYDADKEREEISRILYGDIFGSENSASEFQPDFNLEFMNSVGKYLDILKDPEFDKYAQIIFGSNLKVCYYNSAAKALLPDISCDKIIDSCAYIDRFSVKCVDMLPFQTFMRCEKGVFMCTVSEYTHDRESFFILSVAFSLQRIEHGLQAFLSAKLAIMNLQHLTVKRIYGKKRCNRQVEYITEQFEHQARKASQIQTLMSTPAVLTSRREVAEAKEYLNRIGSAYCKAIRDTASDDRSFTVDCLPGHHVGITPVFAMATVYIIDAMFCISKTGHITLGSAIDETNLNIDVITFKTVIGKNMCDKDFEVSENLTDKTESPYCKMFFSKVISEYAKPPSISVQENELILKLYLPEKTGEYIIKNISATIYRFSYFGALLAASGIGENEWHTVTEEERLAEKNRLWYETAWDDDTEE